jgi:DnaJ-class molecular chaperone
VTPYEILGVGPEASPEEIAAAYKTLAMIYHPDRYEGLPPKVREQADARMKELNEAYRMARIGRGNMQLEEARKREAEAAAREQAVMSQVPWAQAARDRALQSIRAKQAREERERQARNGQALAIPKSGRYSSVLSGLGEALVTNNIKCRTCHSIIWLPSGWKHRLDDTDFFCCFCERLLLCRAR